MFVRTLALILVMSCGMALAQENTSGPYLFDLLKQEAYLSAWKKMLAGETVPAWVAKYATSFNGPTAPAEQVPVGSDTYTLAWSARRMIAGTISFMCCSRQMARKPGDC
jgi:Inhibitor of vertebrate lysozyme (Ivy)